MKIALCCAFPFVICVLAVGAGGANTHPAPAESCTSASCLSKDHQLLQSNLSKTKKYFGTFRTAVDDFWESAAQTTQVKQGDCETKACVPTGFGDSCRSCIAPPALEQIDEKAEDGSFKSLVQKFEFAGDHIGANDAVHQVSLVREFESSVSRALKDTDLHMATPVDYDWDTQRLGDAVAEMLSSYGEGNQQFGLASKAHAHWTTLSLTSKNGSQVDDPKLGPNIPTEIWNQTNGYLHEKLGPILPALQRVRLSNLFPSELITYHVDYQANSPICRCHVPTTGTDGATTLIGLQKAPSTPGAMYCGDFVFPHSVWNNANANVRTHVMMDVDMRKKRLLRKSDLGTALIDSCSKMFMQPQRKDRAKAAQKLIGEYREKLQDEEQRAAAEKLNLAGRNAKWV